MSPKMRERRKTKGASQAARSEMPSAAQEPEQAVNTQEAATRNDRVEHARRVRGKRGILKDMIDMPLDILFEVFDLCTISHSGMNDAAYRSSSI